MVVFYMSRRITQIASLFFFVFLSTNSMYAVGNLTAWEKTVEKLPGPSVGTLQVPPKIQICRKFAYASERQYDPCSHIYQPAQQFN